MKRLLTIFTVAIVFLPYASNACMFHTPVAEEFKESDVVFTGIVSKVMPKENKAKLTAYEIWKGKKKSEYIISNIPYTAPNTPYKLNQKLLIFGEIDKNGLLKVDFNMCTKSQAINYSWRDWENRVWWRKSFLRKWYIIYLEQLGRKYHKYIPYPQVWNNAYDKLGEPKYILEQK